ncbi:MAG: hypothetical protein IPM40_04745 [Gammaproteobacteria bacterium]|jgi:hypothetical protein|nr:hypothetical protein [Gammaproteobacteria bacterium]MBK9467479.1 hypothetical protein [Gammaproteobacteria bacterium]MBP6482489.1 hypothetical protein [Pseudomonadales bacterium]MBP7911188.1 hypothetical protein [Pseudomonadales bacterium]HQY71076.1 hypothetical protein [Pseudomonadales bacterium]
MRASALGLPLLCCCIAGARAIGPGLREEFAIHQAGIYAVGAVDAGGGEAMVGPVHDMALDTNA